MIQNISTHPDYFESDKKNQHDIALLRLNEPIKFNSMVKPACLYTIENDLAENVNLTVTGWGKQNLTSKIEIVQFVRSSKISIFFLQLTPYPENCCKLSYSQWHLINAMRQ